MASAAIPRGLPWRGGEASADGGGRATGAGRRAARGGGGTRQPVRSITSSAVAAAGATARPGLQEEVWLRPCHRRLGCGMTHGPGLPVWVPGVAPREVCSAMLGVICFSGPRMFSRRLGAQKFNFRERRGESVWCPGCLRVGALRAPYQPCTLSLRAETLALYADPGPEYLHDCRGRRMPILARRAYRCCLARASRASDGLGRGRVLHSCFCRWLPFPA